MQSRIRDFRELDADLIAISVDAPEDSRRIVEAAGLEFPVLSDPDASTIEEYGLLHENGGLDGDIARPGVFLIDREGRIVWRDLTENWRVRVRPDELLTELAAIP